MSKKVRSRMYTLKKQINEDTNLFHCRILLPPNPWRRSRFRFHLSSELWRQTMNNRTIAKIDADGFTFDFFFRPLDSHFLSFFFFFFALYISFQKSLGPTGKFPTFVWLMNTAGTSFVINLLINGDRHLFVINLCRIWKRKGKQELGLVSLVREEGLRPAIKKSSADSMVDSTSCNFNNQN